MLCIHVYPKTDVHSKCCRRHNFIKHKTRPPKTMLIYATRKMLDLQHQYNNCTTITHTRVSPTYWGPPSCEGLLCSCCICVVQESNPYTTILPILGPNHHCSSPSQASSSSPPQAHKPSSGQEESWQHSPSACTS